MLTLQRPFGGRRYSAAGALEKIPEFEPAARSGVVLKNILSFSSASAFGQVMRLIQEFVTRSLLPPEIMGLWNFVLVIKNLGASFDFGVTTAARRSIALFHGAGEREHIDVYARTSLVLQFTQQAIIAIGIVVYAYVFGEDGAFETFALYLAAAVLLVLGAFGEAFIPIYQSLERYTALSKRLVVYWAAYAVLLVGGAYMADVKGLIAGMILVLVLQALTMGTGLRGLLSSATARWNFQAAKDMLSVGIPIRAFDYPFTISLMLDVLFVTKFLTLEILAIYATAKMVMFQLVQVPAWTANVIVTRIIAEVGKNKKSRRDLGYDVYLYLRLYYLVLAPLLILVAEAATTFLVGNFLPKYRESLGILPIFLFAIYFLPQGTVIRNFWMVDKRYRAFLRSSLVALVAMTGGLGTLLLADIVSITNVAAVFLMSQVVYFAFLVSRIGPELWTTRQTVALVACIAGSVAVTLVALGSGGGLSRGATIPALSELILNTLLELAIVAPMVIGGLVLLRNSVMRLRLGEASP